MKVSDFCETQLVAILQRYLIRSHGEFKAFIEGLQSRLILALNAQAGGEQSQETALGRE
jgi:hypothetical protein